MSSQKYFDYQFSELKDENNFFVNSTNENSYNLISNNIIDQNIFLFGPKKSGKTHLLNIWMKKNHGLLFNNNFNEILKTKNNIAIDNIFYNIFEEEIFHIINHCKSYNLKILVTSSISLNEYKFELSDLFSRLTAFYNVKINDPDDEMCKILMTKLFYEKQIIIKNNEIFDFILNRVSRTYNDIYLFVKKIDNLSLEKKRQLTIPLIKEIL